MLWTNVKSSLSFDRITGGLVLDVSVTNGAGTKVLGTSINLPVWELLAKRAKLQCADPTT